MKNLIVATMLISSIMSMPSQALASSSDEVKLEMLSLFKEVSNLRSRGYFAINPGGFIASNAEAFSWGQRMMAFYNRVSNAGKAGDTIINLPDDSSVWYLDLLDIAEAIAGKNTKAYEGLSAKFWLASICLEHKDVC